MRPEVVVARNSRCRDLPIVWSPVRIHIHLRIVCVLRVEVLPSIEYFTVIVVMEADEGICHTACCKPRCGAKFVSKAERERRFSGGLDVVVRS